MTQRPPVRSESPFARLGARVLEDVRSRVWPLERGATCWHIAHLELGDWRQWRALLEANGISDPLDLEGVALQLDADAPAPAPFLFGGVPDGAPSVSIDLASSDELGEGPRLVAASPELRGLCYLVIEDVTFDTFTLALRAPGASVAGVPVAVSLGDFEGITSDATSSVERTVYAANGAAAHVRLTLDAFLVVWIAREWPMYLAPTGEAERTELVIPQSITDVLSLLGALT